jgi:hypothetical protein
MRRSLCLLLLVPSFAFSQNANSIARGNQSLPAGTPPSSTVQVLYVVDNSVLTTYNVDPQTFQATAVGTTTMPKAKYASIVTSPNGQFLYYFANPTYYSGHQKLYVFDTDATGVPASTPVQGTNANQLIGVAINPAGTFFYSVAVGTTGPHLTTNYAIVRNMIDPANGSLTQPVTEATYTLDSDAGGNDCYFEILGFNPAGTTLYDGILCSGPHGSGSETFNERSVDLQTGALGTDQQAYTFSYYAGSGYVGVQFENNLLFTFASFFNQGPNASTVQIYQTQPLSTTPLVNCAASMLAICGNYGSARAHPSGEYVFLGGANYQTDIAQVDLTTQQLVQINTVPSNVEQLSPDGSVIYGDNPDNAEIRIAGFNATNGAVKLGGSILLPHVIDDYWIAAERY